MLRIVARAGRRVSTVRYATAVCFAQLPTLRGTARCYATKPPEADQPSSGPSEDGALDVFAAVGEKGPENDDERKDGGDKHDDAVSTEVHEEESFDELEAQLQEAHDMVYALEKWVGGSLPPTSKNNELAVELTEQLVSMLTPKLLDEIGKSSAHGSCGKLLKKGNATMRHLKAESSSVLTYMHSPFELKALREDIPEELMKLTRAKRDHDTLLRLNMILGYTRCPAILRDRLFDIGISGDGDDL